MIAFGHCYGRIRQPGDCGRHLAQARNHLLAFDEITDLSAIAGATTGKHVGAALVRLDGAKSLSDVFNCAGDHDEPFRSNTENPRAKQGPDSDFERKVRSKRDANRAITKASKQIR